MELPKGIKKVTHYKEGSKNLDVIRTDDDDLLFDAHQIMKLMKENNLTIDPEDTVSWINHIINLENLEVNESSNLSNKDIESQDIQISDDLLEEFKTLKTKSDENSKRINELLELINGLDNRLSNDDPFRSLNNNNETNIKPGIKGFNEYYNTPFINVTHQSRINPDNPFNF